MEILFHRRPASDTPVSAVHCRLLVIYHGLWHRCAAAQAVHSPCVQRREGAFRVRQQRADVDAAIAAQQEVRRAQPEAVALQFRFPGMNERDRTGRIGDTRGSVRLAE